MSSVASSWRSLSKAPPEVRVGAVGRSHGLDGSFYVTQPVAKLLTFGRKVTIAGSSLEITRRAGTDAKPIVRVSGCETREEAAKLREQAITVPREEAPLLGENEWYAEDLEGLKVVDGETPVGVVTRLVGLPSCEVLEVKRDGAEKALLVPLVSDAVRSVDIEAGLVEVNLQFLGEE